MDWRTPFASRTMSKLFTRAVPEVGGTSVVNMRIRVDLPAPFGPSNPKISPCSTEKFSESTATKSPKRFVRFSTSTSNMTLIQDRISGFDLLVSEIKNAIPTLNAFETIINAHQTHQNLN